MMNKIMIIITDLTGGGAERVATNLATTLSSTNDVTLVVEHITGNNYGSTVKTIDLHLPVSKGKLKLFWYLKFISKLRRLKKEYAVTHSISLLPEACLANVFSKGKEKVIVSVRNYLSAEKSGILRLKEEWVLKHADIVVALSEMVRQDIVDNFGVKSDRAVTIYNPCYADVINEKCKENCIEEWEKHLLDNYKGNIVISAGRLVDQKAQWHLIRAFAAVVKTIPDAKLIILGRGENEQYLKKLITEASLSESVFMWGYKANPYPYLAHADLFAFSSAFEGLGNILVECMAIGLPVISTDCKYGPKELIAPNLNFNEQIDEITYGKYGILVPPIDGKKYDFVMPLTKEEKYLATAIINMLSDDNMRKNYSEKIKLRGKDFDPVIIANKWENIISGNKN